MENPIMFCSGRFHLFLTIRIIYALLFRKWQIRVYQNLTSIADIHFDELSNLSIRITSRN